MLSIWYLVFGVWCLDFGVWCSVFGVRFLAFGVWCFGALTLSLSRQYLDFVSSAVFGSRCWVSGVWCLDFRVWCLVFRGCRFNSLCRQYLNFVASAGVGNQPRNGPTALLLHLLAPRVPFHRRHHRFDASRLCNSHLLWGFQSVYLRDICPI